MKKNTIRIFSLVMAFAIMSSTLLTANAANLSTTGTNSTRASYYIDSYSATSSAASGGRILIGACVMGTTFMDVIGMKSIVLQVYQSGSWVNVRTLTNSYFYNCPQYASTTTFYGTAGKFYRAVITFYASLDGGYDTRVKTTNYVQAVN